MIASVPLIVEGYPMINVEPEKREEYHWGIRRVSYQKVAYVSTCVCPRFTQACEGVHAPLMKCFVDGMRKSLDRIQKGQLFSGWRCPSGVLVERTFPQPGRRMRRIRLATGFTIHTWIAGVADWRPPPVGVFAYISLCISGST